MMFEQCSYVLIMSLKAGSSLQYDNLSCNPVLNMVPTPAEARFFACATKSITAHPIGVLVNRG